MNLSEINPYIRYARLHHNHLENSIEFRICYDCRLFFMENAEGYITVNEKKFKFSKGTAIFFPPNTKYRFQFTNDKDFAIIIIDFDLVDDFSYVKESLGTPTEKMFIPDKVLNYPINEMFSSPIIKCFPQISTSLKKCTDNFLFKGNFYRDKSSALLKLCLIELVSSNLISTEYSKLCESVISYIHENYSSPSLTNPVIAEKFNYHQYYLNHIIKKETGKSLHKHVIDTRLNYAKNYLLTTSYSIDQISWKTGFSSTSYFIKIFKEIVGMTPNKYRKTRFHTEL